MKERWVPVAGYEGLYEVSSFGRVRSFSKKVQRGCSGSYSTPGRFLAIDPPSGLWPCVSLVKDKKPRSFKVKYLVAAAFVPNPTNSKRLVERDGNKLNCRADNLEWSWRSLTERKKIPKITGNELHQLVRLAVESWASSRDVDPRISWDAVRRKRWHRLLDPEKP